MTAGIDLLASLLTIALALDAAAIIVVVMVKVRSRRRYAQRVHCVAALRTALLNHDHASMVEIAQRAPQRFALLIRQTLESVVENDTTAAMARRVVTQIGGQAWAARACWSVFRYRRLRAYLTLGFVRNERTTALLLERLVYEPDRFCRTTILRQLAEAGDLVPADRLIKTLRRTTFVLQDYDYLLLEPLAPTLAGHFAADETDIENRNAAEQRLFLIAVRFRPSERDRDRTVALAQSNDEDIAQRATDTLMRTFPPSWFLNQFGARPERRFMVACAELLGTILPPSAVTSLDPWFADADLRPTAVTAVTGISRRYPEAILPFLDAIAGGSPARAAAVSLALEFRMRYFAFHIADPSHPGFRRYVRLLLQQNRPGVVLDVLDTNLPQQTRAVIVDEVRFALTESPLLQRFFARHADATVRDALAIPEPPPEEDRPRIPVKVSDKAFVAAMVVLALSIFPTAFIMRWHDAFEYLTRAEMVYRFIFDFHSLFASYTIAVNGFYFLILILSAVKLVGQSLIWESGLMRLLFGPGVLPTVSIIAPAFNEEKTIVDSIESLLTLVYPSVEVIVVNDGSSDGTIGALVDAFQLEPISPGAGLSLPSMPVRTLYGSRMLPNLRVADKVNGGKADALNAGINYATGEYVCCIDADSLLDPQALLRTMLQSIAKPIPPIAIGGNVFPVNGSEVEHGHLQHIGLPTDPLPAFQTLEYLRSFISGRLGWALMDGLLIISGAFGLFRRDSIVDAGGYMTGKGRYKKDTVGEDMELVVRLLRRERERGGTAGVDYCYNANCWTEVPEQWNALTRQRDRWHRGLIEVLLHHRGMAFRPRYGLSGMVSVPYFFLFEMVGPFLELMGYVVLAVSLAFSMIDPAITVLVFSIAIALGLLISISSIIMGERQVLYFSTKDFARLIFLAFVENFGFRQLMSMSRVWAFVQFFYKVKGWQKFGRRGFNKARSTR